MAVRICEDVERLVLIVSPVQQLRRAERESSVPLLLELRPATYSCVEVEHLRHITIGPRRWTHPVGLLKGELPTVGVSQRQPVLVVRLAARRRLVTGTVLKTKQLTVELCEASTVVAVKHHLDDSRICISHDRIVSPETDIITRHILAAVWLWCTRDHAEEAPAPPSVGSQSVTLVPRLPIRAPRAVTRLRSGQAGNVQKPPLLSTTPTPTRGDR